MGIPVLWQILRKHGLVHELGGDSPERVVDVAEVVAGQVVALDLSMWLMQGLHQPQLASTYGRSGAPLKVVFDRVRHVPHTHTHTPPPPQHPTPGRQHAALWRAAHLRTGGRHPTGKAGAARCPPRRCTWRCSPSRCPRGLQRRLQGPASQGTRAPHRLGARRMVCTMCKT